MLKMPTDPGYKFESIFNVVANSFEDWDVYWKYKNLCKEAGFKDEIYIDCSWLNLNYIIFRHTLETYYYMPCSKNEASKYIREAFLDVFSLYLECKCKDTGEKMRASDIKEIAKSFADRNEKNYDEIDFNQRVEIPILASFDTPDYIYTRGFEVYNTEVIKLLELCNKNTKGQGFFPILEIMVAYRKLCNIDFKPIHNPKQGGCYIATSVYASYDCPEVWTLRRYRDDVLANSIIGRVFVYTYYFISPTLVKCFGHTFWFKKVCKIFLDKLIKILKDKGFSDKPYNDKNW